MTQKSSIKPRHLGYRTGVLNGAVMLACGEPSKPGYGRHSRTALASGADITRYERAEEYSPLQVVDRNPGPPTRWSIRHRSKSSIFSLPRARNQLL